MKLICIAALTLATATAFAEGKESTEYYFQPSAGKQAVQLLYNMDVSPGKIDTAGTETDAKSEISDFDVNYAYGLNDNNAFGLYTLFGSDKLTVGTTSHTATGMGDIHLFYKGFTGMWHYGADFGFNTAKIKDDATTGIQDNRTTGGISLKPNVGILMSSGAINYGADLSYVIAMDRQVDDTANTKFSGGGIFRLAPFVEYNWGMGFVGAELSYNMVGDTTQKDDTGTNTKLKGESYMNLALNGSFDFNETFTGLLTLGMGMHQDHDVSDASTSKMKAYTETIAALGVRMVF